MKFIGSFVCYFISLFGILSAQNDSYFVYTLDGDTIFGMYYDHEIMDGVIMQYQVVDCNQQIINSAWNAPGLRLNSNQLVNPDEHIQWHVTTKGSFENGKKIGEWMYHLIDYSTCSPCYGGFSWKREEYLSKDSVYVQDFDYSYTMTSDSTYFRGEDYRWPLRHQFECIDAHCKVWLIGEDDIVQLEIDEFWMQLELGFNSLFHR